MQKSVSPGLTAAIVVVLILIVGFFGYRMFGHHTIKPPVTAITSQQQMNTQAVDQAHETGGPGGPH